MSKYQANEGQQLHETRGILLLNPNSVKKEGIDPNQQVPPQPRQDPGITSRQISNFAGHTQSLRQLSPYEMLNTTDKKQLGNTLGNTRNFQTPTKTQVIGAATTSPFSPTIIRQPSLNRQNSRGPINPVIPSPGTVVQLPNGSVIAQGVGQAVRVPSMRRDTPLTPTRSRLVLTPNRGASPIPYNQQMRLDNAIRKSHEEVSEVIGDALTNQNVQMQGQIDFLAQKLKTRNQEVAMYTNYLDGLRDAITKPILIPNQAPQYVPTVNYQPSTYATANISPTLNPRGRQISPFNSRYLYEPNRPSSRDYEINDIGRRELREQQRLNQQQLQAIQNLESNYGQLKRQLEERDMLVAQQQEEILKYQGKYLNNRRGEEASTERIRRLEHENQLCQQKIDSLEKNLDVLEQEYRYLKDPVYPSYS